MSTTALATADPVWDALDAFKKSDGGFGQGWPTPTYKRFWSPDDDVHGALVKLVSAATRTIDCAMYGWDDDDLDGIFRTAWENGRISVRLCLDKSQAGGVHEKVLLEKWNTTGSGNPPFVIGTSRLHAISHLKLLVVDGLYTVEGSTNWSAGGEAKQNNEASFHRDFAVAQDGVWKIALTHTEMLAQAVPLAAITGK